MKIEHISVSREQVWKLCQQQYKFRYHLKVIPDGPPAIYLTFGKIVHRIIEIHTKSKGKEDINKIRKDILSGKIELEPGVVAPALDIEYNNKLNKHIKHYLKLAKNIGYEGRVEYKFWYDLDPPNKKFMYGFIDRIIEKDGSFSLIDYKTSKPSFWRKDSNSITSDLQLQCYCYVIMREFEIEPDKIQAALFFLDDYKLVPVRFSKQTLLKVPEKMLKAYNDIVSLPEEKAIGNLGSWCKRCDYKNQCPFYALT